MLLYYIGLLVFDVCFASKLSNAPLVKTAEGVIRGSQSTTYSGQKFYSFRGVRYAESTAGPNRFKPPVPVKPWKGVYNATEDNKNSKMICSQFDAASLSSEFGEDCLFLNVYTKKLNCNKAVMVFFHPGGYESWTGSSDWFGPEYLLDKNIVLVTVNYRLAALGFLSMQDKLLKGNYGLKDQVAALRWVQQNIASFGGNPRRVTIFGYSAGGASVMLHMMSPMSQGLFQHAIAMSGSATHGWAVNRNEISSAISITQAFNCSGTSPEAVYDCIKDKPSDAINNATSQYRDLPEYEISPLVFLAPVVEKDYGDGEERFLTADPWELLKNGKFANVPLLTGITKDEFSAIGDYYVEAIPEVYNSNFEIVAPIQFLYERQGETSTKISQALKNFYFKGNPIGNNTKKEFRELYADFTIIFGSVQAAQIIAEKNSKPVYFYQFSYLGDRSFRTKPGTSEPIGDVAHHDDLLYLFNIPRTAPIIKVNTPEAKVVQTLTTIWTEFAKTGVPPLTDGAKWPQLSPTEFKYVNISSSLNIINGIPFPDRLSIWNSLFPLSGPHQKSY